MITIKNNIQQKGIRRSGKLLTTVFTQIDKIIVPGVSTMDINSVVDDTIRSAGGIPAFYGYGGFPASVCTSVNDRVIHGIPNDTPLRQGDVVGCDIGVILDGYYSDACKTFPVGKITQSTQNLLDATRQSLEAAILACQPGGRIKDIGKAIAGIINPKGYGIVHSYCGHGVGLSLHEDPQIPNYYPSQGNNPRLKSGMVLAIEPMINAGVAEVSVLDDGWTVVTDDGEISAHFEHSVLITESGPQILTSWGEK